MESKRFEERALAVCRELIPPGGTVAVACSGGADSMALLTVLLRLAEPLAIAVEAIHIDHGLRPESAQEAEFVKAFCRAKGIPCLVERLTPTTDASEDWARRERYRIFEGLTGQGKQLATAHTASDQAETVLLRLARGTGLHGLGGIPVQRGDIIRPLLWASRQDTEDYCRENGIEWVTDSSNQGDLYARNRVRHHAVPALKTINPQAEAAICRMAEQLGRLDEYFQQKAEALLLEAKTGEGYSLGILQAADAPIRETALHRLISQCRDAEQEILLLAEELVQQGSGAVQLTRHHRLRVEKGVLTLREEPQEIAAPEPLRLLLSPGNYTFGGYSFTLRKGKYETFVKDEGTGKNSYIFLADCDKIPSDLVLRGRQAGDTYCHGLRSQTKTLKKWYNELAIPVSRRSSLPLLAAGSKVIFLWGQGFCKEVQPENKTEWVWILTQEGDNNVQYEG